MKLSFLRTLVVALLLIVFGLAPGRATAPSIAEQGARWALIIHVGSEGRPEVENLAATLQESYGFTRSRVTELYDSEANLEGIRKSMDLFFRKVGRSDLLFVYMSLPIREESEAMFFLPGDAKPDKPWTWLDARNLFAWLGAVQAQTSMMIYPACPSISPAHERLLVELRYGKRQTMTQLMPVCFLEMTQGSKGLELPTDRSRLQLVAGLVSVLRQAAQGTSAPISGDRLALELSGRLQSVALVRPPLGFPEYAEGALVFVPRKSVVSEQETRYKNASSKAERTSAMTSLIGVAKEDSGPLQAQYVSFLGRVALDQHALLSGQPIETKEIRELRGIAVQALSQLNSMDARNALRQIIQTVRDEPSIRRAALSQLSRLPNPQEEDREIIRKALTDDDPLIREVAARGVIFLQDGASADTVAKLALSDASEAVRLAAIQSLSELGRPNDRTVVRGLLKDTSAAIRREAAAALGRMGQDAESSVALLELLNDDIESSAREAAAYALARTSTIGDRENTIIGLILAARKGEASVQVAAAFSLGRLGGRRAENQLKDLLDDGKKAELVRVTAAEALGQMGLESALPALEKAARTGLPALRRAAVSALGTIGGKKVVDILLEKLGDEDPYVRAEAQRFLSALKVQPTEMQILTANAKSEAVGVRLEAIQRLSKIHQPASVAILIAALADENADVREASTTGLTTFSAPDFLSKIVEGFSSSDFRIRRGVAVILGRIAKSEVIAPLLRQTKDPSSAVRAEVIRALGFRPTPESFEAVRKALDEEDPQLRIAAVESLSRFKTDPFFAGRLDVEKLLQDLARNDPSSEVRKVAIEALTGGQRQFRKPSL